MISSILLKLRSITLSFLYICSISQMRKNAAKPERLVKQIWDGLINCRHCDDTKFKIFVVKCINLACGKVSRTTYAFLLLNTCQITRSFGLIILVVSFKRKLLRTEEAYTVYLLICLKFSYFLFLAGYRDVFLLIQQQINTNVTESM